jgi:hypothetical protein
MTEISCRLGFSAANGKKDGDPAIPMSLNHHQIRSFVKYYGTMVIMS